MDKALLDMVESAWRYGCYHRIPEVTKALQENRTCPTRLWVEMEYLWMDLFRTYAVGSPVDTLQNLMSRLDRQASLTIPEAAQHGDNDKKSVLTFPTSSIVAAQQCRANTPLTSVCSSYNIGTLNASILEFDTSDEKFRGSLPALPAPCEPGWPFVMNGQVALKMHAIALLHTALSRDAPLLSRHIGELSDLLARYRVAGHTDISLLRGRQREMLDTPAFQRVDEAVLGKANALGGFPPLAACMSSPEPAYFADLAWRAILLAFEVTYLFTTGEDCNRPLVALNIAWEELLNWARRTESPCFALWYQISFALDILVPLVVSWVALPNVTHPPITSQKMFARLRENLLSTAVVPEENDAEGACEEWQMQLREAVFSPEYGSTRMSLCVQLNDCHMQSRRFIERHIHEKVSLLRK